MRLVQDLLCWVFFTALLAVSIALLPVLLVLGWLFDEKEGDPHDIRQEADRAAG